MKKFLYFLPTFILITIFFLSHNFLNLKEGVVARVLDGDTIELENGERIRLIGIDAPEQGELFYEEAKDFLKERVEGKKVILEKDASQDKDKYGRFLRYVFIEGKLINCELLRAGLAKNVGNAKYECFEKDEKKAKEEKVGIWSS